jgi:hypothetical protein
MPPMADDTVPLSLFPDSLRVPSRDSWYSDDGMVPLRPVLATTT